MDWGPEGFCADCHTLVALDDEGNKAKHCGSFLAKYDNDTFCPGSGKLPEATPDNTVDPWEDDRDPRKVV